MCTPYINENIVPVEIEFQLDFFVVAVVRFSHFAIKIVITTCNRYDTYVRTLYDIVRICVRTVNQYLLLELLLNKIILRIRTTTRSSLVINVLITAVCNLLLPTVVIRATILFPPVSGLISQTDHESRCGNEIPDRYSTAENLPPIFS